jgi:hypothetical protein
MQNALLVISNLTWLDLQVTFLSKSILWTSVYSWTPLLTVLWSNNRMVYWTHYCTRLVVSLSYGGQAFKWRFYRSPFFGRPFIHDLRCCSRYCGLTTEWCSGHTIARGLLFRCHMVVEPPSDVSIEVQSADVRSVVNFVTHDIVVEQSNGAMDPLS